MIDLHCHSIFSDGMCSPEALVQKACAENLQMLALTDHDTIAGLPSLYQSAQHTSLRIISGIEFSCRWKKYDLHVLGLNFDLNNLVILNAIEQQKENRLRRAQLIGEKLEAYNLPDAFARACAMAGHDKIGRPHFARLLVQDGLAKDMNHAFKGYLNRGRPAYVPTPWLRLEDVVQCINEAGGDAILAHPCKYGLTRTKMINLFETFKQAGGAGIEVVSGDTTIQQIETLAAFCQQFDFFASSGSDFHGESHYYIALGRQKKLPLNCKPIWHKWMNNKENI